MKLSKLLEMLPIDPTENINKRCKINKTKVVGVITNVHKLKDGIFYDVEHNGKTLAFHEKDITIELD